MVTDTSTTRAGWRIRLPTAPIPEQAGAPSYVLSRPITGLRVGLRHEGSWRSWMLIVEQWEAFLRRDGASRSSWPPAGGSARKVSARRPTCGRGPTRSTAACGSGHVRVVHVEQRSRCGRRWKPPGSRRSWRCATSSPGTARNMARFLGHPALKLLVLPYPLEARPERGAAADRRRLLPRFLQLLGAG